MIQENLQEMVRKITKFSLIVLPVVALASLPFENWMFAVNIMLGGVISLLSFRVVAWAVRKFINSQMAQPLIMGISILKITGIGLFLIGLMLLKLIWPMPLLGGFTLVIVIIIWQGIVTAMKSS
jgi:hypothetical protein